MFPERGSGSLADKTFKLVEKNSFGSIVLHFIRGNSYYI